MAEAELTVRVRFRLCREDDLPALEWMGLHGRDRDIIEETFAEQERGEALMLVGDAGGFPVAQAWVDIARRGSPERPHLWAVRVFPPLQGAGLGSELLAEAERRAAALGAEEVELSVECGNEAARRLYRRLGYRPVARPERLEAVLAEAGEGQQVMRKRLPAEPVRR
jgi:ribosomal protein S18 acetylase RimI-like enzyme